MKKISVSPRFELSEAEKMELNTANSSNELIDAYSPIPVGEEDVNSYSVPVRPQSSMNDQLNAASIDIFSSNSPLFYVGIRFVCITIIFYLLSFFFMIHNTILNFSNLQATILKTSFLLLLPQLYRESSTM